MTISKERFKELLELQESGDDTIDFSDIPELGDDFWENAVYRGYPVDNDYKTQRLRDADLHDFILQDLEKEQIQDFLDHWHRDTFDNPQDAALKKARLEQAIAASKAIATLAGNPLLLTIMVILNHYQELPRDRTELYRCLADILLHQWDLERALEGYTALQGQVDLRAKSEILRRVAGAMQESTSGLAGNIIDGDRLTDLIEDYLQEELGFQLSRAAAQAMVKQLREHNFILCYLGADSYAFVHRVFLEYFCAVDFVQRFHVEKTMDEAELIDLFDQHCRDDEWREVLRLICGQIDEKFAGKIVLHLANRTDLNQWDVKSALPEFPLAISALSEVRNVACLKGAGKQLMKQTILLVTRARIDKNIREFMLEDMAAACRDLGERWPGRHELRLVALSQVDSITTFGGSSFWPIFVAHVVGDRNIVHQLAMTTKGNHSWVCRRTALSSLAEKWPDDETRAFLTQRAMEDQEGYPRSTALSSLAEKWPDDEMRAFLTQRAVEDKAGESRSIALSLLAEKWPDDETRVFLIQRAVADEGGDPRYTALRSLSEKWPDDETRVFLTQQAVADEYFNSRSTALWSLSEKWPGDETRAFLTQRAVEDEDDTPRSTALSSLAEKWPDDKTREFLIQRAVEDEDKDVRSTALSSLSENWPDDETRVFLTQRAVEDGDGDARSTALSSLLEKWPDDETRVFLTQRAIEDEGRYPGITALSSLLKKWPDDETRAFLSQRAVEGEDEGVRSTALSSLSEKWPDDETRAFLTQRAVEDENGEPRITALRSLSEKWPDDETRALLTQRAIEDKHWLSRRNAAFLAAKQYSQFGQILFTHNLDGIQSYLEPRDGFSQEHIERAAQRFGIPPDEIETQVQSLSEFLGWDIRKGSKATTDSERNR